LGTLLGTQLLFSVIILYLSLIEIWYTMENIIFTQLSISEIRQLFRKELENYFEASPPPNPPTDQADQLLTIDEVSDLLRLTKSTLYSKVSKGELPGVCKQGKRLYFSKQRLVEWIKSSQRKSNVEIAAEAEDYINKNTK